MTDSVASPDADVATASASGVHDPVSTIWRRLPLIRPDVILVLVLSLSAGLGDAFAFLALGGIFTANMTGNVVLSTLFTRDDYATTIAGVAGAVAAFAASAFLAFRAMERAEARHDGVTGRAEGAKDRARGGSGRRVDAGAEEAAAGGRIWRVTLLPALVVQTLAATLWSLAGGHQAWVRVAVVMAAAGVSGLQSAAMKRTAAARGATTTYVTGTIVGIMDDLASGRGGVGHRVASIVALIAGGLLGCAVTGFDARLTPWACVLTLATALAVATRIGPAGRA